MSHAVRNDSRETPHLRVNQGAFDFICFLKQFNPGALLTGRLIVGEQRPMYLLARAPDGGDCKISRIDPFEFSLEMSGWKPKCRLG